MKTPIRRTQPKFSFVQVPNLVARDYRLSWRARGLLVELLSYPPGWETTVDDMVDRAKKEAAKHGGKVEGREAMRSAANELVQFGYIIRNRFQDERGHWRTESVLSEEPLLTFMLQEAVSAGGAGAQDPVSGVTCGNTAFGAGQAEDGFPGVGFPAVGFPGRISNTESNTDTNKTDGAPSAHRALDVRRTGAGSRGGSEGGFAASGNSKPRLTREQKQMVQAVRDLLPRDLDRALPVKTPRNIADDILAGLAEGTPRSRTPEQLVAYRVLPRWERFWASKFYAGELGKQPFGPLRAMVTADDSDHDRCDERVDVDTAEPCRSCEVRKSDRKADRQRESAGAPGRQKRNRLCPSRRLLADRGARSAHAH
ncbi:hypothetical protein SAMN05216511_7338 [Streptomyces sp. KS_16]|uniref:hypothetical protein n=1 Tax=Streptomyces sp. KS_16 TaxID=1855350 RepID=UPI000887ED53|nr:hypothetical protein [Streptomyces sp. KS_16]SDR62314.1 hypothetical protein SAMN05216511_7338 [Streptomyces sp. KS_16]